MKIATTSQMKAIDEKAINELGIPSLNLMENAAGQVTEAVLEKLADDPNPKVLVICGTGNNGGDGLACARQLMAKGIRVSTILVGSPEKQTPDSKINAEKLHNCGGEILEYTGQKLPKCSLIVDALFGFGLNREVGGCYREIIEKINAAYLPVIACDIPSGLNGDTGVPLGIAVRAEQTICFTCVKPGLLMDLAAPYVGTLHIVDIGIPERLMKDLPEAANNV